ncbi:MAG: aromatic amino acid lyase, partial [Arenimonas sp.]
MKNDEMKNGSVLIEGTDITIEDVIAVATRNSALKLSDQEAFRTRISRGAEFVDRLIAEDGVVYGVSTGYGDSCTVTIPPSMISELPAHLYTYHGCGLGRFFDEVETRA